MLALDGGGRERGRVRLVVAVAVGGWCLIAQPQSHRPSLAGGDTLVLLYGWLAAAFGVPIMYPGKQSRALHAQHAFGTRPGAFCIIKQYSYI